MSFLYIDSESLCLSYFDYSIIPSLSYWLHTSAAECTHLSLSEQQDIGPSQGWVTLTHASATYDWCLFRSVSLHGSDGSCNQYDDQTLGISKQSELILQLVSEIILLCNVNTSKQYFRIILNYFLSLCCFSNMGTNLIYFSINHGRECEFIFCYLFYYFIDISWVTLLSFNFTKHCVMLRVTEGRYINAISTNQKQQEKNYGLCENVIIIIF